MQVEAVRLDDELVAGRPGDDHVAAERLPELGDVRLQDLRRRGRRAALPEVLDQPVARHRLAGVQQQNREQRTWLRRVQRDDVAVGDDFERPEYAEVHGAHASSGSTCHRERVVDRLVQSHLPSSAPTRSRMPPRRARTCSASDVSLRVGPAELHMRDFPPPRGARWRTRTGGRRARSGPSAAASPASTSMLKSCPGRSPVSRSIARLSAAMRRAASSSCDFQRHEREFRERVRRSPTGRRAYG